MSDAELKSDEEELHSSFRLFICAVEMLAAPAEEQCRLMGDYNVAWELKDDVAAGQYLLGRGYLSAGQESWVGSLVAALAAVDTIILPAGPGREANLQAMSHPSWEPLRFIAKEVLAQLAPFSASNAIYLGLSSNAA